MAAYQTSSPSLRASLSSTSARPLSGIRLICSNCSSTEAPRLGAAWQNAKTRMTNSFNSPLISTIRSGSLLTTQVSRLLLQLGEESLAIQLGNDAAVHEFRSLLVFEQRIGKCHALELQRHRFFPWVGFARHPTD